VTDVMKGFRILEVAEHTFVPAASALLAEWGAEVIKIEHVERGDAMRGLAASGTIPITGGVHVLLEHSNRGKRSLGLDLSSEEGLDVLYRLAATCDVFLTNKLPSVRKKLKIDRDDILGANPRIVYASGCGQGELGPDADAGSYDMLGYWSRSGVAYALSREEDHEVTAPPPAFGDSIGAMTIAGGIMGALLHRERTGEATTVDVSLLGVGLWSMGAAMALSLQLDMPWKAPARGSTFGNPLVGTFETSDGRFVALTCLQGFKYWAEACEVLGIPELATDERFADAALLAQNGVAATERVKEAFASRTADEWRERLAGFSGQWAMVQSTLEAAVDPMTVANGYVREYATSEGTSFSMVAPPVRFGGDSADAKRAPEFNEHGDDILGELGLDMDAILDLKLKGVVA
jgi:crotonobetainyl-CoA:carnitine CoA-transferase CaiB-like acyl-CoA transferase